jgi:hypothetical protein
VAQVGVVTGWKKRRNSRWFRYAPPEDSLRSSQPMLRPKRTALVLKLVDLQLAQFGNSTEVAFKTVEGHLSVLADLDEVAVGIAHVATPFPAVIVQRLS